MGGVGTIPKTAPCKAKLHPRSPKAGLVLVEKISHIYKVAAIIVSEPSTPRLRRGKEAELQQAKLDDSLAKAAATPHVLTVVNKLKDLVFVPTLSATINFEGIPVSALLDTSSPIAIDSLSFLLQAFKQQCTTDQTPAEWLDSV